MASEPIEIVEYRKAWSEEFDGIAATLRAALGEPALRIDHIGSTSVPDLASKDVIDLQITLRSFDDFRSIQAALETVGFRYRECVDSDHRPLGHARAGELEADPDWEKRYFREGTDQRVVHIHIRAAGRANQQYALLFRDYLRQHTEASAFYAEIKRCLAEYLGTDRTAYVTVKDPVCDLIIDSAERWASETGWEPGPSDA